MFLLASLKEKERIQVATDISIAALIAPEVYNFGELVRFSGVRTVCHRQHSSSYFLLPMWFLHYVIVFAYIYSAIVAGSAAASRGPCHFARRRGEAVAIWSVASFQQGLPRRVRGDYEATRG